MIKANNITKSKLWLERTLPMVDQSLLHIHDVALDVSEESRQALADFVYVTEEDYLNGKYFLADVSHVVVERVAFDWKYVLLKILECADPTQVQWFRMKMNN